jgi:WS/DGAT/MGAT family acyltransferase
LNDVVLALCSGALRRYLARHGGIPREPLLAAVPVSVRDAGSLDYSTQVTLSLVNLHTDTAEPAHRLAAIHDAASAMKRLVQRARNVVPTDFPSIGMPWVLHGLALLYGRSRLANAVAPLANVLISNVAGPVAPLYLAGARVISYWPLSAPEHGIGLNITVLSYAGTMGFGIVAAQAAVRDAHVLVVALRHAFDELVATLETPAHHGATAR